MSGVFAVVADEELRTSRVAPGVGHREHTAVVTLARSRSLALDGVARTSRTVALGASALDHEVGNHAVERQSVVEIVFGQLDEIGHGSGSFGGVKLGFHHPFFGRNDCVFFHIVA